MSGKYETQQTILTQIALAAMTPTRAQHSHSPVNGSPSTTSSMEPRAFWCAGGGGIGDLSSFLSARDIAASFNRDTFRNLRHHNGIDHTSSRHQPHKPCEFCVVGAARASVGHETRLRWRHLRIPMIASQRAHTHSTQSPPSEEIDAERQACALRQQTFTEQVTRQIANELCCRRTIYCSCSAR